MPKSLEPLKKTSSADRLFTLGLGILVLLGIGIRLWRVDHGLPHFFYMDEGIVTYQALNMGGQGFNPHDFRQPTLFHYFLSFLDGLFILGGMMTGIFRQPNDAWKLYLADPTIFYVMGRYASAVFGVLTVFLIYLVGKKLFSKEVGLVGSLFLTFSLMHVQWSQLAYSDVPLTFLIVLAFFFAHSAVTTGSLRYFVISGGLSGLAFSTKYQGLMTLLWGPLASSLWALRNGKSPIGGIRDKRNLLFLLFFAVGFTLGTPFWIIEFRRFVGDLLWNWINLRSFGVGQLGYEGDWNWVYYLTTVLPYGLGLPVEICGMLGLILLAIRPNIQNLFFIAFPTIYFFVIGLSRLRVAKYLLPVFPFLCLAAAFFLVTVVSNGLKNEKRGIPLILFLTSFLVVSPSLLNTLRYAYLRMFPDTRELTYAWIREHISSKSKVLQSSYTQLPSPPLGPQIKRFDPTFLEQKVWQRSSLKPLKHYRAEGFEYLVLDEWHAGMALIEAARQPRRRKTFERYQNFLKELEESSTLLTTFSPYRSGDVPFDMENVEITSRSLWKMRSSGPTVWVYKL